MEMRIPNVPSMYAHTCIYAVYVTYAEHIASCALCPGDDSTQVENIIVKNKQSVMLAKDGTVRVNYVSHHCM